MSKQWHPLCRAPSLELLLGDHYEIQTEVPVSDLPRKGDLLLLRRRSGQSPFHGLWEHLTEWNVQELKGPTDDAEGKDLELLVHVGTGLTYRLNEERQQRGEEPLANRQVSLWYLACSETLGETFREQAQTRTPLEYQTGGLWRGSAWGHPVWLLAYRDATVEVDTIPLHLLDREPAAPRALAELVVQQQEWLHRFATWLSALQPELWKEIRLMASTSGDRITLDWKKKIAEFDDLDLRAVGRRFSPVAEIIQLAGIERAIQAIGLDRIIASVGLPKVIGEIGADKLLRELLPGVSEEERQELLRKQQKHEYQGREAARLGSCRWAPSQGVGRREV